MGPIAEPISPELVLVADDLREAAIAALPDIPLDEPTPSDPVPDDPREAPIAAAPAPPPAAPPVPVAALRVVPPERLDEVPTPDRASRPSLLLGVVLYTGWHLLLGALLGFGAVLAVAVSVLVLRLVA